MLDVGRTQWIDPIRNGGVKEDPGGSRSIQQLFGGQVVPSSSFMEPEDAGEQIIDQWSHQFLVIDQ